MADPNNSVERVRAALLSAGHEDTIAEFPDGTRTAADAAAAVGCTVAQIAKSIVLRAGDQVVLVIASGVNRVDVAKVSALFGVNVVAANGRWVRDVTGFAIGGVAPVGHLTTPRVLIDEDLMALDPIWAAAGSPKHAFRTSARELVYLTGGQMADAKATSELPLRTSMYVLVKFALGFAIRKKSICEKLALRRRFAGVQIANRRFSLSLRVAAIPASSCLGSFGKETSPSGGSAY